MPRDMNWVYLGKIAVNKKKKKKKEITESGKILCVFLFLFVCFVLFFLFCFVLFFSGKLNYWWVESCPWNIEKVKISKSDWDIHHFDEFKQLKIK